MRKQIVNAEASNVAWARVDDSNVLHAFIYPYDLKSDNESLCRQFSVHREDLLSPLHNGMSYCADCRRIIRYAAED